MAKGQLYSRMGDVWIGTECLHFDVYSTSKNGGRGGKRRDELQDNPPPLLLPQAQQVFGGGLH